MKRRKLEPAIAVPVGAGINLSVPQIELDEAGRVRATVEAWGDRLLHQDVLIIAGATARHRFARALSAKTNIPPAVVDEALLALGTRIASGLGSFAAAPTAEAADETSDRGSYEVCGDSIVRVARGADGATETIVLTNFTARIVEDVVIDDGAARRRFFRIAATLRGRSMVFDVPSERFAGLTWPVEHLGVGAIVYPGKAAREHFRVALQTLSGEVPERVVYAHTGWRRIADTWVYLHAAGAIGVQGPVPEIGVSLPDVLSSFVLPDPPEDIDLRVAFRASLGILHVGPDIVTHACVAAVYRAPLGDADFSLHLVGPSGVGKSELAALLQQHWGAAMDARHLPAGWDSTGNALERIAHAAKDTLLVVDDFSPGATAQDVARRHRDADRLLRALGNQVGRARLSAEASFQAVFSPCSLILSTGEDVPRGHSLRARILVIEIGPDAMHWDVLGVCQCQAASGLYAAALVGYLRWLAPRYDRIVRLRRHWLARLRRLVAVAEHKRTPEIIANLLIGLHLALRYGRQMGAVSLGEARKYWHDGWTALRMLGTRQTLYHEGAEPARRFFDLLRRAIVSRTAHVASGAGACPTAPQAWGWSQLSDRPIGRRGEGLIPHGVRIGWVDGDDLYLDLDASYHVAQEFGRRIGEPLALSPRTVCKRLAEQNLLVTVDPARESLTVRRVLEGVRRSVLHVRAESLVPRHDHDQPDHAHDRSILLAGPTPARRSTRPRTVRGPTDSGQNSQVVGVGMSATESSGRTIGMPGPSEGSGSDADNVRSGDETPPAHPDQTETIQLNLDLEL